ncbi:MAG: phosphoribosylformylglycinamidine cyclo-ligase [Phycisphaerae bacterium]|nr:phosphoribosylformylglycinamidine cyclo-ligase [Phycisphaerae bacterium]
MTDFASYEKSGVSIDANDEMVGQIYASLENTFSPRVIAAKNGFAGMFRLDYNQAFKKNYKNPVLVACTDGVGSKVQLAAMAHQYDTVGIDLVAMSVNDMLVVGAEPLFFLDYLGVHKLEPAFIAQLVKGVAAGCTMADCSLIGGETAEMPDTYRKDDFDMAGFAVGVVERGYTIEGDKVRPGDVILGLASSGLHSNGYTLARDICFKRGRFSMTDQPEGLHGARLGDVLLTPTRIYVKPVVQVLADHRENQVVHAMAHITGGGLVGNVPRVLPKHCDARIDTGTWPVPDIFPFLQDKGPVQTDEMYRVFNMGIGFVLVVDAKSAQAVSTSLADQGEKVFTLGEITEGTGQVRLTLAICH